LNYKLSIGGIQAINWLAVDNEWEQDA